MINKIKSLFKKIVAAKHDENGKDSDSKTETRIKKEPQTSTKRRRAEPKIDAGEGKRDYRRPKRTAGKEVQHETHAAKWTPADFKVPPVEGKTRFHDLNLPDNVLHAIADLGFQYCTPIQSEIMPHTLTGRDATGRAQTGTGKTAAFLVSIITRLNNTSSGEKRRYGTPRALILAPTRELVMQIADEALALTKYTDLRIVSVFGGMDYEKQRRQLTSNEIDIVVATPGRLLDFQRKKDVILDKVEILIIDEADRMLDMGFIPDVRKIVYSTPHKNQRQTLLFSATLTIEVTRLAAQWTKDPITVEIEPEQVAVDTVEQIVYIVTKEDKHALLYNIVTGKGLDRVLVFCNRKDETRRLEDLLKRYSINCAVLSGDVRQKKRIKTLEDFKGGKIRVLVATDVAGRGIHIEGMDHVINYTLPRDPEDYVHRIGRTGRAGAAGTSISFADEDDSFNIPAIEKLLGHDLPCTHPDDHMLKAPPPTPRRKPGRRSKGRPDSPQKRRRPQQRRRRPSGKSGQSRPRKPKAQSL